MMTLMAIISVMSFICHELMLLAAVGIVISGFSDLAVDLIWIARAAWRRLFIYSRFKPANSETLTPAANAGPIAIFIPAWDESAVIEPMLRHAVASLGVGNWRIYVGAYPNDPDTIAAVSRVESLHVRLVVGDVPGPTTKADCLNTLWKKLEKDEHTEQRRFKAIVLHDAEDVVHPFEVRLFDRMIEHFDLVQLPVLPLIDRHSRWIGGHYNDEFAEHHSKTIVVREAIGAAVPAAGVGCAFSRDMLGRIAAARGGTPFDHDSLTEDYELGLRIGELGGRAAFVRLPVRRNGPVVAVRAHFPATLRAAVRQKARWMTGIALSGWDRLGWNGSIAERWMRVHDRRAPLTALIVLAAYVASSLYGLVWLAQAIFGTAGVEIPPLLQLLVTTGAALMIWRLSMRCFLVTRAYGVGEGIRSIPRAVIGNFIMMMAASRALSLYLEMRRSGTVRWDKTDHHFPDLVAE
ncbi:MAG: glycosyl transferase family protein [Sphingomonadales bacterium]